jgi:uncharacterized integral membrane protein (TIGR00698 family)
MTERRAFLLRCEIQYNRTLGDAEAFRPPSLRRLGFAVRGIGPGVARGPRAHQGCPVVTNPSVSTDAGSQAAKEREVAAHTPGRGMVARLLPGLALLLAVGDAGKWGEFLLRDYGKSRHLSLPNIEYVLWAIVLGLVVGNVGGGRRWFAVFLPGINTYEFFLKVGIALLGVRFLLGDVLKLGGLSLGLVFLEFGIAGAFMVLLGRWFRLGPKLTALLAIGSSICGVSAIIATQGAIDADDEEASYAIGAILALGAASLFVFPAIGHALHMSDHAFGLWAGLAIDNTAEVTAAGSLFSEEACRWAVLAKTARNATIGFVVLGVAIYFASRGGKKVEGSRAAFVWARFPKFVLGFLLLSAAASAGAFTSSQIGSLANLSRWAFLLTFAGVGLKTNFAELRRQGLRPLLVGAIGEVVVAILTLGMVLAADRAFHLG